MAKTKTRKRSRIAELWLKNVNARSRIRVCDWNPPYSPTTYYEQRDIDDCRSLTASPKAVTK